MEPVSIAGIIELAVEISSSSFQWCGLKLECDVEDGLPDIVGDKGRLEQDMVNLISNVFKFTEKGSVLCKARVIENEIIISVKDTGGGINEDDIERVFDKFRQIGVRLKTNSGGWAGSYNM